MLLNIWLVCFILFEQCHINILYIYCNSSLVDSMEVPGCFFLLSHSVSLFWSRMLCKLKTHTNNYFEQPSSTHQTPSLISGNCNDIVVSHPQSKHQGLTGSETDTPSTLIFKVSLTGKPLQCCQVWIHPHRSILSFKQTCLTLEIQMDQSISLWQLGWLNQTRVVKSFLIGVSMMK